MRPIAALTLWLFVIGSSLILAPGFMKRLWWCRFGRQEPRPRWRKEIRCCKYTYVQDMFSGSTSRRLSDSSQCLRCSPALGLRRAIWHGVLQPPACCFWFRSRLCSIFVRLLIEMVVNHGAGLTPKALTAEVRRWVVLDWVRTIAVAASLAMGIRALLLPLR